MMMLAILLAMTPGAEVAADPRAVALSMFDAFNRHDADAMARLYAPDARLTSSDYCGPRGRDDVARSYHELFVAFPDIRDDVETVVAEGDYVAVRFTAVSRQGGLSVPIQAMLRVRGGLIVNDDAVFDNGGKPCEP